LSLLRLCCPCYNAMQLLRHSCPCYNAMNLLRHSCPCHNATKSNRTNLELAERHWPMLHLHTDCSLQQVASKKAYALQALRRGHLLTCINIYDLNCVLEAVHYKAYTKGNSQAQAL